MTKALPFTEHSIARIVKGIERAGRFVVAVKPDGTLLVGDKPFETASLAPVELEQSPPVKTAAEYFNGGAREA